MDYNLCATVLKHRRFIATTGCGLVERSVIFGSVSGGGHALPQHNGRGIRLFCTRDETEQICFDWTESGLIQLFGSQTLTACLMRFLTGLLSLCDYSSSVSHAAICSLNLGSHPAKSSGANQLVSYGETLFMSQLYSKLSVCKYRCETANNICFLGAIDLIIYHWAYKTILGNPGIPTGLLCWSWVCVHMYPVQYHVLLVKLQDSWVQYRNAKILWTHKG